MIATMSVSLPPRPKSSARLLAAPSRMTTRRNGRHPSRLDLRNQRGRQRHIVELGSHRATVLVGPCEELEGLADRSGIRGLLVNKDKACARDWPTLGALLVGEDQIIAFRMGPVRIGRGRLEGFGAGFDCLTCLVDQLRIGHLVLFGVG